MRERLTYANVMSSIAFFVAIGLGGAYAADKITSKDLAKGSVKSKAIKNKTIVGKDVKDGSVLPADLAPVEITQVQLGNGAENDCIWVDGVGEAPGISPVSYRRNGFGEVSMMGIAQSIDGPGGDANCDGAGAEATEDGTVFTIPSADRPARSSILLQPGGATGVFVVGANGAIAGTTAYPPGAVITASGTTVVLDGISFLAADALGPAGQSAPDRFSPRQLREVLHP